MTKLCDGEIEVALLCGNQEPTDPAYKRCTVAFEDGVNTAECRFGPYVRNFRNPITAFALYLDGERLGQGAVGQNAPPREAEVSVFEVGSLKIEIA